MKKLSPAKAGIYAALTFWALTTLYPFVWVILNSFRERGLIRKDSFSIPLPGNGFTLGNYDKAMEQCLKRRARDSSGDDTGLDGLEALARKRRKPDASNQRKGS